VYSAQRAGRRVPRAACGMLAAVGWRLDVLRHALLADSLTCVNKHMALEKRLAQVFVLQHHWST
jgi:hypothetical protein